MKKLSILSLLILFSFLAYAQEEAQPAAPEKPVKEEKAQTLGVTADLFTDLWMDAPDNIDLRTIHQGLNFGGMYARKFGDSPMSIAIGAVLGVHNMYSNGVLSEDDSTGISGFSPLPETDGNGNNIDYDRNKLTLAYIDFPLELRLKTKSEIRVAVGFKAGFLANSHTKYKGDNPANATRTIKVKEADLPNIEKARYGVTFRAGYKQVNFYAFYSLSKVFEDGAGPAMYPVSLGISLRPY